MFSITGDGNHPLFRFIGILKVDINYTVLSGRECKIHIKNKSKNIFTASPVSGYNEQSSR
jgi:hypothetical protein